MAQFTRIEVFQTMKKTGLVPLFYNQDIDVCKEIVKSCFLGGARLLEFTARGDFAHEVFGELLKFTRKELPEMILGVGSVTDAASAGLYMQLGANFIITPVLREDIALICNRRKVLWSPGCASLSEIAAAEELGCEIVKLFPGGVYGSDFVKAIKAPQPWTNIMPTGGVTIEEENLKKWFDAGVSCVGIGSSLISKDILIRQDYKLLKTCIENTLETIKKIRNA